MNLRPTIFSTMAVIGIAISMIAAVAALGGAGEGAIGQTAPADSPSSSGKCADLKVRREWRELEASEQTAFTNAVKCLKAKPSGITGISSPSRFDDAAYVHQKAGGVAHGNRDFLPWHRNYLKLYERTLQVECGYTGTLPYWDW